MRRISENEPLTAAPKRYRVKFRGVEAVHAIRWDRDIAWRGTEWEPGVLTCLAPIPGIEPDAERESPGQPREYLYFGPVEWIYVDA